MLVTLIKSSYDFKITSREYSFDFSSLYRPGQKFQASAIDLSGQQIEGTFQVSGSH
jgi:hypothetical protein